MKLLSATSFFFCMLLFLLNSCESNKIQTNKQHPLLSTLKDKAIQKINEDAYDSAIFYNKKLLKVALKENEIEFVQKAYNNLSYCHGILGQYDSAVFYTQKMLKNSLKAKNAQSIKKAYDKLARYYSEDEKYDSAIYYSDKLYEISLQTSDTLNMAKASFKKGYYYEKTDSLVSAYKNFLISKNLYLKIEDSLQVAEKLIEISSIEKKIGDLASSQLSAIEGLKYVSNPKRINIISRLYYSVAVSAKEEGNLIVADKRIDEALVLAKDSATISKIGIVTVVKFYNTKANIFKEKGNYTSAIEIYENILNNSLGELPKIERARVSGNLAHTLFLKEGYNKRSDSLLHYSLIINKEKEYNSGLISTYMKFAELYRYKDKQLAILYTNNAIEHARNFNNNMSIYEGLQNKMLLEPNEENNRAYVDIEQKIEKEEDKMQSQFANAKFDLEKEENQRIKAENIAITFENKASKSRNFAQTLLLILIVLVVLIIFIYQRIKRRHKIEKVKTVHVTEARISSKVHDELANDLYKLISQLETTDPEKEVILDKLDVIYNQARDISKQIQGVETGKGFAEELSNLFRSYQSEEVNVLLKRYNTDIWNGISAHIKVTVYRVLQELLTNMKKHSNAALVVVSIEKQQKQLFIQYIDNGKGFDEEISKNGLQNAENRIHAIKGTLTFDTELHKGCKFSINVPV